MDILQSILMAVQQIEKNEAKVEIEYRRAVRPEGNTKALKVLYEVFEVCDVRWRGLGMIPQSGIQLKKKYSQFDAESAFEIPPLPFFPKGGRGDFAFNKEGENISQSSEPEGCLCGEILRGIKVPTDCTLFGKVCTPEEPVGPCMVSSEGTCAAYFKYVPVQTSEGDFGSLKK